MYRLLKYFHDKGSNVYAGLLSARLQRDGRDEGKVDTARQEDSGAGNGVSGRAVSDVLHGGQHFVRFELGEVLGVVCDEWDQLRDRNERTGTMDRRNIESPAHYTQGKVEAWDVMENNICRTHDSWVDYLACTAYKYIHRAPHKGHQAEDYGKAIYCLQRAIEALRPKADAALAWANEDLHSIPRGIDKYEECYRETARRELFGETAGDTNSA